MKLIIVSMMLFISTFAWTANYTTPTKSVSKTLSFDDDHGLAGLKTAIDRQIEAFDRMKLGEGTIQLGVKKYPRIRLKETLQEVKSMVGIYEECTGQSVKSAVCMENFSNKLNRDFSLYRPKITKTYNDWLNDEDCPPRFPGNDTHEKKVHFTAYYSPVIEGSLTRTERFKFGIYKKPATETLRKKTFSEIVFDDKLEGKDLALFYVEDPFDMYLLHVEGGGRIKVTDDKGVSAYHFISYSGHNSNKLQFLVHYMLEKEMIDEDHRSIEDQRKYIEDHPEKRREIFDSNPSYVYFKLSPDHPPIGVADIPLTDMRSVALDKNKYRHSGLLSFVVADKPVKNESDVIVMKEFSRFMIHQDTGSKIIGANRADLYFGIGARGSESELAANNLNNFGEMYFLIKK